LLFGAALLIGTFVAAPAHAQGHSLVMPNGKCLDYDGGDFGRRNNGGKVQSWDCNGGPNQKWHWVGSTLRSPNGKCLDYDGGDFGRRHNGGKVQTWDCNGGPNQQWSMSAGSLVASNGKCLDNNNPEFQGRVNGGRIQAWECNGGPNQQFSPGGGRTPVIVPEPPPPPPVPDQSGWIIEPNLDRPGNDYRSFDLTEARPEMCKVACGADLRCAAFTFQQPNAQSPNGRCWLKDRVPAARPNANTVVGIKGAGRTPGLHRFQFQSTREPGIDRIGYDYDQFNMPEARPELCQAACDVDQACSAWAATIVNQRERTPHCWLKRAAARASANPYRVSGVRGGTPAVVVAPPQPVYVPEQPVYPPQPQPSYLPEPQPSYPPPQPSYPPQPVRVRQARPEDDFSQLLSAVQRESFSDGKLSVLESGARGSWFTVDQAKRMIGAFSFSQDKLNALQIMAPQIVDRQNLYQIYSAFTFSSDKEAAKGILQPYQGR